MIVSILKALFLLFAVFAVILWVYSLVTWDGKCHNSCEQCPYYEDCDRDEKQDKSEMEDKKNANRK